MQPWLKLVKKRPSIAQLSLDGCKNWSLRYGDSSIADKHRPLSTTDQVHEDFEIEVSAGIPILLDFRSFDTNRVKLSMRWSHQNHFCRHCPWWPDCINKKYYDEFISRKLKCPAAKSPRQCSLLYGTTLVDNRAYILFTQTQWETNNNGWLLCDEWIS